MLGFVTTDVSREPTPFPREVEVLRSLKLGEVSAPIDTLFGFQILVRTPERPRREYAMRALRLRFDPSAADGDVSWRVAVRRDAEQLAARIAGSGRMFEEELGQRCCQVNARWEEGRGYWSANAVLDQLAVGGVAARPVEWDLSFLIVQRVAGQRLERLTPCRV